jgi:transcriptional regulator with XRE-family HTH domain
MSQHRLAVAAGLGSNQVGPLECGRHEPMASTLAALADVLGCALDDLFVDASE